MLVTSSCAAPSSVLGIGKMLYRYRSVPSKKTGERKVQVSGEGAKRGWPRTERQ